MRTIFTTLPAVLIFILGGAVAQSQEKGVFTHTVGQMAVSLLPEAQTTGNPSILIGATEEMKKKTMPDGTFPNATNAFVIQTPTQNILIDAGLGKNLLPNLKALGIEAENIHLILISHMHGDHIGGLTQAGKAAFANARLCLAKQEYDYWENNPDCREVIDAYREKITFLQSGALPKGEEVVPGIVAIAAPGHTPGHTLYELRSDGHRLLIWADLTHAMAIQMPYPQVSVRYDTDPAAAARSRAQVLEYVSREQIPVAGMHIAWPGMGTVEQSRENGYTFTPIFTGDAGKK